MRKICHGRRIFGSCCVFSFLKSVNLRVVSWRCWLMMSGTFSLVGGFQDVLVFPWLDGAAAPLTFLFFTPPSFITISIQMPPQPCTEHPPCLCSFLAQLPAKEPGPWDIVVTEASREPTLALLGWFNFGFHRWLACTHQTLPPGCWISGSTNVIQRMHIRYRLHPLSYDVLPGATSLQVPRVPPETAEPTRTCRWIVADNNDTHTQTIPSRQFLWRHGCFSCHATLPASQRPCVGRQRSHPMWRYW